MFHAVRNFPVFLALIAVALPGDALADMSDRTDFKAPIPVWWRYFPDSSLFAHGKGLNFFLSFRNFSYYNP